MELTKHARKKQRRRGITDFDLNVIERYGRREKALGGAIKIVLGRKERQEIVGNLKYIIQLLDKAHGTIIEMDGKALTTYK